MTETDDAQLMVTAVAPGSVQVWLDSWPGSGTAAGPSAGGVLSTSSACSRVWSRLKSVFACVRRTGPEWSTDLGRIRHWLRAA